MSPVLPAARQGDRHSHSARVQDSDAGALLAVVTGALVAAVGEGGVATAVLGAGVGSGGGGGAIAMREVVPNTVSGAVAKGSPRTMLGAGGLPAALAEADPVDCRTHSDGPIRMGSVSVFIDGLRVARATDETKCGAMLCDGDKTILVGGAPADGAPPDPLTLLAVSAATAGAAVGNALAAGTAAVDIASRWAESLLDQGASKVDEAISGVEAAAGAVTARAGALVSDASGALLGALWGGGAAR